MIATLEEDDDIVPGPQKMSLKCPVRTNLPFEDGTPTYHSLRVRTVEFHSDQYSVSVVKMRASSMFRRYVVVLRNGANYNVVMSRV